MAGDELDALALVDWVRSAGHSFAGTRAFERSRHHRDSASAP